MTAGELIELIRKRYEGDAHIVLTEVPNGTGSFQHRWIDAAVFSLWPSKGLTRSAFEVKVSRPDFIHELQNPAKHQWVRESFHEFWIVAPKDIVQVDELPNGAGFMYPRGEKLCIKKYCTRNENPKLDDVLLAGFMRAAWKGIKKNSKITKEAILADSEEYKRAGFYRDGVLAFLEKRGSLCTDPKSKEDIIQCLEKSTENKEIQQDRERLLRIADRFQSEVANLFGLFATIANHSLLARDEMGQHIVSVFGGDDPGSIETLKQNEYAKRYANLVETILEWQKVR